MPARLLLIGENPGRFELVEGRPFVGRAGKLLDELLGEAGLHRQDIRVTNRCGCVDMGREDRRPLPAELDACWPRLNAEITLCDPKVIVLIGNTALAVGFPSFRIGEVYGAVRAFNGRLWVASYHPAASLRSGRHLDAVILDALKLARRLA